MKKRRGKIVEKRYFEVECGDFHGHQIVANSHEQAFKKFLIGKNPEYWAKLGRVREDHQRKEKRQWFYIDPLILIKNS